MAALALPLLAALAPEPADAFELLRESEQLAAADTEQVGTGLEYQSGSLHVTVSHLALQRMREWDVRLTKSGGLHFPDGKKYSLHGWRSEIRKANFLGIERQPAIVLCTEGIGTDGKSIELRGDRIYFQKHEGRVVVDWQPLKANYVDAWCK